MSALLFDAEEALVPAPDPEDDRAAALLALINRERAALGRRALAFDEQLGWVADWKARDMSSRGYYSHTFPEGGTVEQLVRDMGGPNRLLYENAWSCAPWLACTAETAHHAFMASEGHRDAVLLPGHTHAGLGFAENAAGDTLVVQLFARQDAG